MYSVKLSQVAEINPRKRRNLDATALCSFVPMEYVDDDLAEIVNVDTRIVADVESGYTAFENDDVLFAKITPCMENGKIALAMNLCNGVGFGSTEFHVVRASNDILPQWIYYFLRQQSVRDYAERNMTGSAGQKRVPTRIMEALEIPLPPLDEQKRIAAILEEADHARRTRRFTQSVSDTFLQEVFVEMFGDPVTNPMGWEFKTLKQLKAKFKYGTSEKCDYDADGLPVLRIPNVLQGEIDLTDLKYAQLPKKEAESLLLEHGDLIFVRTNGNPEYVGRSAVFDLEMPCLYASYLIRAR